VTLSILHKLRSPSKGSHKGLKASLNNNSTSTKGRSSSAHPRTTNEHNSLRKNKSVNQLVPDYDALAIVSERTGKQSGKAAEKARIMKKAKMQEARGSIRTLIQEHR